MGRLLMPDLFARLDRAAALISARQQWDDQGLAEIFTNHDDVPRSICRHARAEDEEYLRMNTIASCIIDPTESRMQVSLWAAMWRALSGSAAALDFGLSRWHKYITESTF
jgi:hypothetical protein